jgi:hypothetical protein
LGSAIFADYYGQFLKCAFLRMAFSAYEGILTETGWNWAREVQKKETKGSVARALEI